MDNSNLNKSSLNKNFSNRNNSLEIVKSISKVAKLIDGFYEKFYKNFKLTKVQFKTMYFIYLNGDEGLTISELSNKLNIKKPTTTNLVYRMESNGLVKRVSKEGDRRSVIISLTENGEEIINKVLPSDEEFKLSILDFLTEDDKEKLGKLMNAIEKELTAKLLES